MQSGERCRTARQWSSSHSRVCLTATLYVCSGRSPRPHRQAAAPLQQRHLVPGEPEALCVLYDVSEVLLRAFTVPSLLLLEHPCVSFFPGFHVTPPAAQQKRTGLALLVWG